MEKSAPFHIRRRRLMAALLGAGGLGGAACAQQPTSQAPAPSAPAQTSRGQYPSDVGRKFNVGGAVRPFVGNSFVGHVGQQGDDFEFFDGLLNIYRDMPLHAFSRKMALVPPSSYHVTLIGGINDVDRNTVNWPPGVSRDTPFEAVHRLVLQRLDKRSAPPFGPCDFVVDQERKPRPRTEGSLGIPMRPADEATATRLRSIREELADLMQLRRVDHDNYRYHITVGYLFEFLTAPESEDMREAAQRWITQLALRPPLRIRQFDFCVLRDMYAYRAIKAL